MNKYSALSLLLFMIVWQILALCVHQEVFLPGIPETLSTLWMLMGQSTFYTALGTTICRVISAVGISMVFALFCAFATYRHEFVKGFLQPYVTFFKSIPSVSIAVLLMIWMGRDQSILFFILLLSFPLQYQRCLFSLENMDRAIVEETSTYADRYWFKVRHVYFPMIRSEVSEILLETCSLSFKACIMAEILVNARSGIGRELFFAKTNLETPTVFAWSLITVLIALTMDKILIKKHKNSSD